MRLHKNADKKAAEGEGRTKGNAPVGGADDNEGRQAQHRRNHDRPRRGETQPDRKSRRKFDVAEAETRLAPSQWEAAAEPPP